MPKRIQKRRKQVQEEFGFVSGMSKQGSRVPFPEVGKNSPAEKWEGQKSLDKIRRKVTIGTGQRIGDRERLQRENAKLRERQRKIARSCVWRVKKLEGKGLKDPRVVEAIKEVKTKLLNPGNPTAIRYTQISFKRLIEILNIFKGATRTPTRYEAIRRVGEVGKGKMPKP